MSGECVVRPQETVYSFVAPADGNAAAILVNNPGEQVVAVLENAGLGCQANTCVSGDETAASFSITAGQTYFIVVDAPAARLRIRAIPFS